MGGRCLSPRAFHGGQDATPSGRIIRRFGYGAGPKRFFDSCISSAAAPRWGPFVVFPLFSADSPAALPVCFTKSSRPLEARQSPVRPGGRAVRPAARRAGQTPRGGCPSRRASGRAVRPSFRAGEIPPLRDGFSPRVTRTGACGSLSDATSPGRPHPICARRRIRPRQSYGPRAGATPGRAARGEGVCSDSTRSWPSESPPR